MTDKQRQTTYINHNQLRKQENQLSVMVMICLFFGLNYGLACVLCTLLKNPKKQYCGDNNIHDSHKKKCN